MRKLKVNFILIITMLVFAVMPTSVFALSGAGSQADPYIISSEADLRLVEDVPDAYYKLGGNIVLSASWSPIGSVAKPFDGVFDGDGFTVSGLNITVSSSNAVAGLFAYNTGEIKNLNVEIGNGLNVTANESAYVGAICGYNMGGSITDCHVEGNMTVSASTTENTSNVYVGMIAGKSTGKISNTSANGTITVSATATAGNRTISDPAQIFVGGLIGLSTAAQEYNFAIVDVHATATSYTGYSVPEIKAGGIVGENSGNIMDTYAAGNVTAAVTTSETEAIAYAGGLIGKNSGQITYTNATGNVEAITNAVSAKTYAGGLIGYSTGNVTDSYATGMATAESSTARDTVYAGGLVALGSGLISNCYAVGEATATAAATNAIQGGLVGYTAVAAINSYYKNTSAYTQLVGCGTAKTESELRQETTYSGWNFDNIWKTSANYNSGYPYLIDISNVLVSFADATYVYDGTEKVITATEIGENVTVEYKNNRATEAGVYNAVAIVNSPDHSTTVITAKLTILEKELTITGLKANDKEFDNTTATTVDISEAVIDGVIDGDDVRIDTTNTVANFVSKNIGENIEVIVSGIRLTGADANNYKTGTYTLTANIFEGSFDNVIFEGNGTQADPYIIYHEDELSAIKGNLTAHFKLANNISLTGNWIPIGRVGKAFEGSFDGNGYTISGVSVDPEINYTYSGLFGYNAGTIKNLNVVTEANIYTTADKAYIGAIAGYNRGILTNVSASGNIETNPASTFVYVGGLVGINDGTITYSDSNVNISAKGSTVYVGGVAGENKNCIETTGSTGTVTVTDSLFAYAGGFTGNNIGTAKNSYSTGDAAVIVSDIGFMLNAGGFAGRIEGGSVTNCYSAGAPTVSVGTAAYILSGVTGGFTAYNAGLITGCYYDSDVSGMTDTDKGTPKTTAELKTQSTYSGWNFEIWRITEDKNNGYPHIKKLYTMMENAAIQYNKSTGVITVNAYTDIESAYLIAASYSSGALVDIDIIAPVSVAEGEILTRTVKDGFKTVEGGSVKVMLWENLTTIRPLCSFVSVQIR